MQTLPLSLSSQSSPSILWDEIHPFSALCHFPPLYFRIRLLLSLLIRKALESWKGDASQNFWSAQKCNSLPPPFTKRLQKLLLGANAVKNGNSIKRGNGINIKSPQVFKALVYV